MERLAWYTWYDKAFDGSGIAAAFFAREATVSGDGDI